MTRRAPVTPRRPWTADPVRNDPPEFASQHHDREVDENSEAGTLVGPPLEATDPNSHAISYTVSANDHFSIGSADGQVAVASGASLDHEQSSTHSVTITATDSHGGSGQAYVTISIVNVDEPGAVHLTHGALRVGSVVTAGHRGPGRQRSQRGLAVEQRRWSHQRRHRRQLHGQAGRCRPHTDGHRPVRGRPRPGQVRRGQHGLPGRQRTRRPSATRS